MKKNAQNTAVTYALLVGFLFISGCAMQTPKQIPTTGIKWHPGHYILVKGEKSKQEYLQGNFLGIQKKYAWKDMEPEQGKYNFTEIKEDLKFLEQHGKRLVVQIQTKDFGEGKSSMPDYLRGSEFGLSTYQTATGSINPVYWNPKVGARIEALYTALGKAFDKEAFMEAMVIPETAISVNVKSTDQASLKDYTPEKYAVALEQQMQALKNAFPNTVVIQFTNFPKEALDHMVNYQKNNCIGMGGPDINLYSNLNDPKNGVYRYYDQVKDAIPLGAAVQSADYSYDNPRRSFDVPSIPTIEEIYKFGRDRLHLNYIFWLNRPKYFEQVLAYMNSAGFPKNAAGGLNTQLPSCFR